VRRIGVEVWRGEQFRLGELVAPTHEQFRQDEHALRAVGSGSAFGIVGNAEFPDDRRSGVAAAPAPVGGEKIQPIEVGRRAGQPRPSLEAFERHPLDLGRHSGNEIAQMQRVAFGEELVVIAPQAEAPPAQAGALEILSAQPAQHGRVGNGTGAR